MTDDKVYIASSDDRELIPPNTYFADLMKTSPSIRQQLNAPQIANLVSALAHVV